MASITHLTAVRPALPVLRRAAVRRATTRAAGGSFGGWGDLADGNTEGVAAPAPRRVSSAPKEEFGRGREPREEFGRGRERSFNSGPPRRGGPISRGPPPPRPGDWSCGCGAVNFASRTECYKCAADVSLGQPVAIAPGRGRGGDAQDVKRGDWKCPDCGFLCFASRTECFKCQVSQSRPRGLAAAWLTQRAQAPRGDAAAVEVGPAYAGRQDRQDRQDRPEDWSCPGCQFSNFASRMECRQCGEPRP